ncbi:MAG TPA: Wzy polymerase domain-containing protein [Vicinamibacterales bacterium]|jgi:TolA-binding protein|nr:Wzy polymerase domain-containing protein [Vicinamibacterales bacterium]
MKRTERQHLKEHELAQLIGSARDFIEPRRKQLTAVLVALVVVAIVAVAAMSIRQRRASRGQDLLAEAMVALNARVVPAQPGDPTDVPAAAQFGNSGTFSTEKAKLEAAIPKLKAAADAYPDSEAGITARYHLASAYAALGQPTDAIREYDDVIKRAGDSLYGHMAKFGKADTLSRSGQTDAAIAAWKDLSTQTSDEVPQDAVLLELGKAYMQKGNKDEARKTYTDLVDQHPDSVYSGEARQELENLKRAA